MEKVLKLLKANTSMALATSSNDKPRSSIMEYVMVGDNMICSTSPDSIKGKNLAKNPKVSLTVGGMPTYVAIDGKIKDPTKKEIEEYNKVLIARYPHFKEIMATHPEAFKHFRVVFDTAYYTECPKETEIIKMGK